MVRPAASGPMVGRRQEVAVMRRALDDARAGTSRFVLLGGEAGVGKSRLLHEVATLARGASMSVHRGVCPPAVGGIPVPFAPFSSVLRSVVRSVDARLVDHLVGSGRRELALLLPELGDPDPTWTYGAGAARLFEAVLLLLDRAARRAPGVVLLLDDLHWSEASARALLAWLVTELRDARVLLVAAYRNGVGADPALAPMLSELSRSATVDWLELGPLAPDEATALLQQTDACTVDAARIPEIVRRSGGIPLYLEELACHGPEGPPASVRMAVERAAGSLDATARAVVELVATAGATVQRPQLAEITGLPPERLEPAIAAALEAGLVVAVPGAAGRADEIAIRHALIGEAFQALAGSATVASTHHAWAEALERRGPGPTASTMERTALIARHRLASGDIPRSVTALVASAEAALAGRAFSAAHAAYERAIDLAGADLPALVPDPVAVLDAAAGAAWLAGQPSIALARSAMAARLDTRGDPVAAARRRVRDAGFRRASGDGPGAIADLEAALAVLPPGDERWRALIDLGRALIGAGRASEAVERCEEAAIGARDQGLTRIASRAVTALALALSATGAHAEAAAVLERRIADPQLDGGGTGAEPSRVSRLPDAVMRAIDEATIRLRDLDPAASLDVARQGSARAVERGLGGTLGTVLAAVEAWNLVRLGRWQEAARTLDAAPPDPATGPPADAWRSVAGWLAAAQGRTDEASALLSGRDPAALPGFSGPDWDGIAAAAAANVAWSQGALLEARAIVRRAIDAPGRDPVTVADLVLLGLAVEAAAVEAARARTDPASAADAREVAAVLEIHARRALEPAAGVPPAGSGRARWAAMVAARLDGELARVRGETALGSWELAVTTADTAGDPWSAAIARLRLGEALLHETGRPRGRTDEDRSRATRYLREAFELADGLGASPIAAAVERLARRARVSLQPGAGAQGPRAAALALGLSEREVDVLALLALGRTDREIGRDLFITEKTAGHHVSHILSKLDVTRRGEAAAVAHRIGLVGLSPPS